MIWHFWEKTMNPSSLRRFVASSLLLMLTASVMAADPKPLRVGIIGLDTSHSAAFTKILHDGKNEAFAGIRVVAAFPGGSMPGAPEKVAAAAKQFQDQGIEIMDSIPKLLEKVDVVMLESVDGRVHLEQARPVFEAKKPIYIDKPLAASLKDSMAIAALARKHEVPFFTSSSLRYTPGIAAMRDGKNEKVGKVIGADAWSPCPTDPTHPDLFWYGIHGVETLFTIMGPGCVSVTRCTSEGTDVVVGTWNDGRLGTFRGLRAGKRDYGATAFGDKGIAPTGSFGGYEPLVVEIARFFRTGKPPVAIAESLEIIAFMEAADESKRRGGVPVKLEEVMAKAREGAK